MNILFKINKRIFVITLVILIFFLIFNYLLILGAEGHNTPLFLRIISDITGVFFFLLVLYLKYIHIKGFWGLIIMSLLTILFDAYIVQVIINLTKLIFVKKKFIFFFENTVDYLYKSIRCCFVVSRYLFLDRKFNSNSWILSVLISFIA